MASSILIFLAVLNRPHQNRYKIQNFCLIGIIPGPHEPEITVNSYINPLISDLKLFWDGVEMDLCLDGCHFEKKIIHHNVFAVLVIFLLEESCVVF